MINKIGTEFNIKNIGFRAENDVMEANKSKNNITKPEIKADNKGLEALAIYNSAMINKPLPKNKLDIEPLVPIVITPEDADKMDGERIYSSDGKLHSIVRHDEDTVTVFTPDKENEKVFSEIITYDKATGKKPLIVQTTDNDEGNEYIVINEYDPASGKNIRSTSYVNGKIDYADKTIYEPSGKEINISRYYDDNRYIVHSSDNRNSHSTIVFDKDKQVIEYSEDKNYKNHIVSTEIEFYHGAPYKVESEKTMFFPNIIGWEKFINNDNLKPAEPVEKIKNIKEIEGEKTYYSNGAIESNTFNSDSGKTTAFFRPDGSCCKITSDRKDIEFDVNKQIITEKLENGKEKITQLYKDGNKKVELKDDNNYQVISYYENGKPNYYSEGIIKDGEECETTWLSYDESGMLNYAGEYDAI